METQTGYQTLSAHEAARMIRSGERVVLVDVRSPRDRQAGSIPGSLPIVENQLERLAPRMLPNKNAKTLVYCQTGARSWLSASRLSDLGYSQVYDMGGYLDWRLTQRR